MCKLKGSLCIKVRDKCVFSQGQAACNLICFKNETWTININLKRKNWLIILLRQLWWDRVGFLHVMFCWTRLDDPLQLSSSIIVWKFPVFCCCPLLAVLCSRNLWFTSKVMYSYIQREGWRPGSVSSGVSPSLRFLATHHRSNIFLPSAPDVLVLRWVAAIAIFAALSLSVLNQISYELFTQ